VDISNPKLLKRFWEDVPATIAGPIESILPAAKQATIREATRLLKVVALILQMQPARKTIKEAIIVGRFPKQIAVGVQKTLPMPRAKTGYEMMSTSWALSTWNSIASAPKPVVMPAAYMLARKTMRQILPRAKCLMYAGQN